MGATLFMAISVGMDWFDCLDPIHKITKHNFTTFFTIYISFMAYAVLNVGSGIFIDSAFKVVLRDHDHKMHEEERSEKFYTQQLKEVFYEIVGTGRRCVSWKDIVESFDDLSIVAGMSLLGIDAGEARQTFRVLEIEDHMNNSRVTPAEFVAVCQQIRRPASVADINMLRVQLARALDAGSNPYVDADPQHQMSMPQVSKTSTEQIYKARLIGRASV